MRSTALIGTALVTAVMGAATTQDTEIFVLGALGALHEKEESFRYETLDRVIRAIKPDVMLLEVTPEELAGRLETKGRSEYPNVVWPMLGQAGAPKVYAMEAAQPLYGELINEGNRIWGDFAKQRNVESSALTAHSDATTDILLAHWKSAADTQDEATDALADARNRLIAELLPTGAALQVRWDRVMVDVVRKAIAENPGKRVLVLGSHRNRFMFVDVLREVPGTRLVDMKGWMVANGFGRDPAGKR